ncbi:MAG: hypothetical protein N3G21_06195 [Candidatus Hydrogenedentes bacterium]|nr:hypothetical protein [Candidatus Hydrogenedentota bacterium]
MKSSEVKKIEDTIRAILRNSRSKQISRATIKRKLTKAGYSISDIEKALNKVFPVRKDVKKGVKLSLPEVRVPLFFIPEVERVRYSREAYSALVRLHSYQMLDAEEWRILLDKLTQAPGKIFLGKVLEVLEEIVLYRYPMERVKVIFDVALGSKAMYQ